MIDNKKTQMPELHSRFLNNIKSDNDGAKKDYENAVSYIKNSTAVFSRGHLRFNCIPKIFDKIAYDHIDQSMQMLYSILDKAISQYLVDEKFRELFEFHKELEDLIMLDSGYECKLPIARFDIFLNEQTLDFKFCELNADGASAMNEDRELGNAWHDSDLWKKSLSDMTVKRFELFDSWVASLDSLYNEYLKNRKKSRQARPTLAIVDFLEIGTKSEFEVFRKAFEKAGFDAVVADIRKLKFKDGKLYDERGVVIDVIYRRAVTSECMQKIDSIPEFLKGVHADSACLVGHFRTQVIHDKNFFRILRLPYTKKLLNKEQNDFVELHVPVTTRLNSGEYDYDEVVNNKDRWLIKPADRYGSQGVATGGDYTKAEFKAIVDKNTNNDYVLQEYCPPYKTANAYYDHDGKVQIDEYNNMTGIFYYTGKLAGLYARQMTSRVTTKEDEGRVTGSILVE